MKKYILFIPVLLLAITSCKPSKEMLYFSEMAKDGNITQVIPDSIKEYESPIKPDDMLIITVTALDPNAVELSGTRRIIAHYNPLYADIPCR